MNLNIMNMKCKITKSIFIAVLGLSGVELAAQDLTVCASSSYSIPSVTPAGNGATYVWMENGVEIAGATDVSYTNSTGKAAAGTYIYTRMAKTPNCRWQASNSFVVWVMGSDGAPVITSPTNKCSGEDFVFTVPLLSGTTYEWTGGGVASGNSYTYSSATAGAKMVTVRAVAMSNGANCTSSSAGATVTVYATPTITAQPAKQEICPNNKAQLSVTASDATAYQWLKNGTAVTEGSGYNTANYTTAELDSDATYSVVASNAGACSVTSSEVAVAMKTSGCCDAPGATVTFTAFDPCTSVPANSAWMLKDDREKKNEQTYKVKIMADGRYWMVQNLKFGEKCNKTTFAGSKSDRKDLVATGYYGDCRNNSQSGAGYLYDWSAAINKPGAYHGSYSNVGCAGTGSAGNACQGLCPNGWHVPTKSEFEDANTKFKSKYGCGNTCWHPSSQWEGVLGGLAYANGALGSQNSEGYYWSSTYSSGTDAFHTYIYGTTVIFSRGVAKSFGFSVRCVKNQ
jgi:uncharacterized protein (TIGR02145 family)